MNTAFMPRVSSTTFVVIPRSLVPALQAVLRIATGLLFLDHGTGKLFGFPALPYAHQEPAWLLYFTGAMELIGGALITLGLFTRPVAFILSGYMAVAYFMAHAPKSFFPAVNGGDAAILYCIVFLFLVAAGPGPLAIDKERQASS